VSTFPPIECGIATYTQFLSEAMSKRNHEIHIISEKGAQGVNVHPVYTKTSRSLSHDIYDMSAKVTPDMVHIQHEFGLFGETCGISILDLIFRYKANLIPVVATFHTVLEHPDNVQHLIMSSMCRELNAVIVHEKDHIDLLLNVYGAEKSKIYLIPHGARDMPEVKNAKEKLGFENKKVVLLAGYFRPTKEFHRIINLFPEIVKQVNDSLLVISGKVRVLGFNSYRDELFNTINNSPVKNQIEVLRGQFPQLTFDTILSASDVMVFPYSMGAQSGVMAHAMTFGKPVVTSNLPAFKAIIKQANIGFTAASDEEYVSAIVKLLTDEKCYSEFSANAKKHIKENISWDIIAEKSLEVYQQFNPADKCKTRYVYFG